MAPHDGALRLGGEKGSICIPPGSGDDYAIGIDAVQNGTAADIQVKQVRLIGAKNVRLIDGYLAPIVDQTLVGAMPGWPPSSAAPAVFEKKAVVPTSLPANGEANLLVHVNATVPAQVDAVEVTYVSDGKTLRVRNTTMFAIEKVC